MQYRELVVLLPCHSLEDFPTYHEGESAEGLLAAWSASWHPALVTTAGRMPGWHRADTPPEDVAEKLLIIPPAAQNELPSGYAKQASADGAKVIRGLHRRSEIVDEALAGLGTGAVRTSLDGDFLALGLCYLLAELLTRRMRYISHLNEEKFNSQVLAAAQAAVQGDDEVARTRLAGCFDLLAEMRGHFYGVDAYLLDLTLVAPTTMGQSLQDVLANGRAVNLILSGSTLDVMAEQEPQTLAMLRSAIEQGTASVAGGELVEEQLSLLTYEEILAELQRGLSGYEKHLGMRPKVFARRRYGLTPVLPQILSKLGFEGALHFTLDDGQFPTGDRSKSRWEGTDGSAVDALMRVPLDASAPQSFLQLPDRMGDTMDYDMVATVCFAHWPGQVSYFYDDLYRMATYTPVIGKFSTLDDFVRYTASSGMLSRFEPDEYRSPYLHQAVIRRQADPISRSVARVEAQITKEMAESIATLSTLLAPNKPATTNAAGELTSSLAQSMQTLASTLAGTTAVSDTVRGYLAFNPFTFPRRMPIAIPKLEYLPAAANHIKLAGQAHDELHAVVEVPPMGFAWIGAGDAPTAKKLPKPMVEGLTLRNEFCEVAINATSGTIQSVHDYRSRGNRLSQQIAFRLPNARPVPGQNWTDPDDMAVYSVMAADSVEVTSSGPPLAEVVSRGRLLDLEGRRLAGFQQTTQLWFGSRIIQIELELDIDEEPRADPWNSYYAARFAWSDAGADILRDVSSTAQRTDARRLDSPLFVEVHSDPQRTTILTGGVPYHRRMGMRMLDTLLVVRGESARKFRLGIGIDLPNPVAAAIDFVAPTSVVADVPALRIPTGWLFHINARNVIATHWQPIYAPEGHVEGFRVRLLETQGRGIRASLLCYRAVASARQVDFRGHALGNLPFDGERVDINMSHFEWAEVEVLFD